MGHPMLNFVLISVLVTILFPPGQTQDLIFQYGYVVKIYYAPLNPEEKPLRCTAAIYNSNWVVTSARCALYSWRRKNGHATHDYADLLYGEDKQMVHCKPDELSKYRFIIDVALPPGLNETIEGNPDPNNDIALLKVNKPFNFSKFVTAIRTATSQKECDQNKGVTLGWGVTGGGEPETGWTSMLRKIEIDLLTQDDCKGKIPDFNTENRICGQAAKKTKWAKDSTCKSDTGGPLVKIQEIKLKQAPVPKKVPMLCGVLPISVCDRTDVNKADIVEYYSNVPPKSNWIKKVAGKQNGI